MGAYKTIGKGLNEAQYKAFIEARDKAELTDNQAVDTALKLFVESQGIEWPPTARHGGDRKSKKARGE